MDNIDEPILLCNVINISANFLFFVIIHLWKLKRFLLIPVMSSFVYPESELIPKSCMDEIFRPQEIDYIQHIQKSKPTNK